MNDTKNILIAWISSISSVWTALEAKTWITFISAIVLPIVFFIVGKAADVALQIYFRDHEDLQKALPKKVKGEVKSKGRKKAVVSGTQRRRPETARRFCGSK